MDTTPICVTLQDMQLFLVKLCEELKVSVPDLVVSLSLQDSFRNGVSPHCCYSHPPNGRIHMYMPDVDRLNVHPYSVLAHEVKHHEQRESLRLRMVYDVTLCRPFWMWDGILFSPFVSYMQQPWEQDAIAYERLIAIRYGVRYVERAA